jgi:hypothetical protein
MAINSTFYLDAADLATATAVYLDLSLTLIAPDGFYGDGTITREQSGGILLTAETCSECPTPCGSSISGSGGQGIYQINLDAGSTSTGAIVIKFDPFSVPDGIRVTYNGTVYNKLSSPYDGVHQSPNSGHFTVVGYTAGDCGLAGVTTTIPAAVEYLYDGTVFNPTGGTQSVTIAPADVSLSSFSPGVCVMVIPKPTNTPSNVFLEMLGPCSGTAWNIDAVCPVALPTFGSSDVFFTAAIPCATSIPNTFYFAKVHTAADSYVGLYDYVFVDENGQNPLPNGYYLCDNTGVSNNVIHVVNGIVIGLSLCS